MTLTPYRNRLRVLAQMVIAMLVVFGLAAGGWAVEKGGQAPDFSLVDTSGIRCP